jgi:hypothetical protein
MSLPQFKNKTVSEVVDIITTKITNFEEFCEFFKIQHDYLDKPSVKKLINFELSHRDKWTAYQRIYYMTNFVNAYKFATNIIFYTTVWPDAQLDIFVNNYELFSDFYNHTEIPQWMMEKMTFKTYVNMLTTSVEKDGMTATAQNYKDTISQLNTLIAKGVKVDYSMFRNRLKEFHDYVSDLYIEMKHAPYELPCEHIPEPVVIDKYKIEQPKDSLTLVKWGAKVRNCVGSYAEQVLRKSTLIFMISEDDKPTYTIEIAPESVKNPDNLVIKQAQRLGSGGYYIEPQERSKVSKIISDAIKLKKDEQNV